MSEGHKAPRAKSGRPKRHWAVRLVGWLFGLFLFGVILAAAAFFIGYKTTKIPDPNKDFQTNTTYVYYNDFKNSLGSFQEQNRSSVALKDIPKFMQDAAIAAEDRTFWTNPGISPSGITRAAWNIARGEQLQGGSTITQQYVKVLYLTQERTWSRKLKELFISIKLSRSKDKKQILEGYLNTIYFGDGAYGVRAAAKTYFNRDNVTDLTVPEAAYLATVLNNPSLFDPTDGTAAQQRTLARYRYVLDGMRQMGTITPAQYAQYAKALPKFNRQKKDNRYAGPKGFLLDLVRRRLQSEAGFSEEEINGGGLRVKTTFDYALQQDAEKGVQDTQKKIVDGNPKRNALHIGLASVNPQTGELVAMYGGPDFLKSQINWATAKTRPGSSFKPYAVAAALKDGKTLRDRFQGDSPIYIDGHPYKNEFNRDYGNVSLMKATEQSINTAFYDLADNQMDNGPSKVVDAAEAAGIPKSKTLDNSRSAPAVVLGPDAYASAVDQASAYGTFANLGKHTDLSVIKEVRDSKNRVLWTAKPKQTQAFDENVAADTSYALQQVVKKGTGTRALDLDRPAAGKTGTAGGTDAAKARANLACKCQKYDEGDDILASWWVGYTPQLSTAVVFRAGETGESDLDPYSSDPAFFGGRWPLLTWLAYMKPALDGKDVEDFPQPSDDNREITPSATPTHTVTQPTEQPTQPPSQTPTQTPTTQSPTATKPTRTKTARPTRPPKPPITIPPPTTTP